jgi:hypothetical protein
MRKKWFFLAPLAGLGVALVIFIGGEVVMHLWNWNLPPLFGWREITFWQAISLFALCRILFGGSGPIGSARSNIRRRMQERWARRMDERCANMTPEERERFRQRMRERWGFGSSTGETKEQ